MLAENFVRYLEDSIRKHWTIEALSDYRGESFTYVEVGEHILKFHLIFEHAGIQKGDKIALLGKNSARWAIVYLSAVTYGAVIVPILPDFKPEDIHNIVNHSDSVFLFCSDGIFEQLDPDKMGLIRGIISLNNFDIIKSRSDDLDKIYKEKDNEFTARYQNGLSPDLFALPETPNSELAVISYTSGTTGFSKGVMLQHNSLAANIRYAQHNMPLNPGDPIVSFLPLAHTFGAAFEFLFPFSIGCHITILTKTPSPQIIMQAFQEIKPALILSVPLVIEKIYKKQLIPVISKSGMKILLHIPLINKLIHKKINRKLTGVFGGNFSELVIGGAALNLEAETFFRKIRFRYTVGYGMTECGPLISYASWETNKLGSAGKAVDTLEVKIDSPDPHHIVGEIILRGENVMTGYYKNEKATRDIIDENGWMHTGDLGLIDKEGFIFIKGRSKSLLLGANGKNIYPEEIEALLNNKYGVAESLVVQRDEKLVALIFPDQEIITATHMSQDELKRIFEEHRKDVNAMLPLYMNISRCEIHPEEFAKTPKRSIKRFLYN
ncbi:MAG: AMP-binding protein [Bacteroidales bacterium]|nr:AMP-binding protein [Bacteroidales bacterium]